MSNESGKFRNLFHNRQRLFSFCCFHSVLSKKVRINCKVTFHSSQTSLRWWQFPVYPYGRWDLKGGKSMELREFSIMFQQLRVTGICSVVTVAPVPKIKVWIICQASCPAWIVLLRKPTTWEVHAKLKVKYGRWKNFWTQHRHYCQSPFSMCIMPGQNKLSGCPP